MDQDNGERSIPTSKSIDKSRVLDIKPLRSLDPVFPSKTSNVSSISQGGPPFVCVGPFGPFPPGVTPFYPFFDPNTPTPTAIPINSFRSPGAKRNGVAGSSRSTEDTPSLERRKSKSQKRIRRMQDPNYESHEVDADAVANDILSSLNPTIHELLKQSEDPKEAVSCTLMVFELLRRRITQIEESKEATSWVTRRPDLKAGATLMKRGIRANMTKRIGNVPGVEIGDIFFFRIELCLMGIHAPSMAGIDVLSVKISQEDEPLAVSIVSSGGYEDNMEDPEVLIYSGQGGVSSKDKEGKDQKLERGNLALEKSLHKGNDVRVIRGVKDVANPNGKVYVYDGLYKIQDFWVEKSKSGYNVFKYKLVRVPGQPEAYMIWKSIQHWSEKSSLRMGVILPDLTSGAESLPVCLVNDVDNEKGPAYFTYVPALKYSKTLNPIEPSNGCVCLGGCQPNNSNCHCIQKNGGFLPCTANGVLVNLKSLIYECGPSCQCPPKCRNRVSQGGLKIRLEVFKTKEKGWGLRSWDPIRSGAFICEYAGIVTDKEELDDSDDYVFDSTRTYPQLEISPEGSEQVKIPFPLLVTAKNVGNVARFMNHSCSPNIFWRPVLHENSNECDLHIGFFATRHIPPMSELTYDYGMVPPLQAPLKKKKCLCGSVKCKGFFY